MFKWGSDDREREDQEKAHRQVVAFMQIVDCVPSGLSGVVSTAPEQAMSLPKVGLWMEMITVVTKAALQWRWREDVTISSITALKVADKLTIERYQ